MFDATEIRNACCIELVEAHDELESTNDRALELVRTNQVTESALIVARIQNAGRGQRARTWWSNEKSLTFTWVKNVNTKRFPSNSTRILPMATANIVADAVESLTDISDIKIKWPNDVVVKDRKLAGILIETVNLGDELCLVVGIGVNVNQNEIPPANADVFFRPTSIRMETDKKTSPQSLLISITQRLDQEVNRRMNCSEFSTDHFNRRLAYLNESVKIERANGESLSGKCLGVALDGSVTIQSGESVKSIYSGTLRPIRKN
jgi:BirA family biotin operon repressor/biotin-[acetyl-CoA-carboxylase] ligase